MHDTSTGQDLYEEVSKCVNAALGKTHGIYNRSMMCGHRSGLVVRMRERMQAVKVTGEFTAYRCIIHQESLCGKTL